MKKILLAVACFLSLNAFSQTPYTYSHDGSSVILNGMISKYILLNDSAFTWYKPSVANYAPSQAVVEAMSAAPANVSFILFGGTWCEDTQNILPKFFSIQEKSGFPDSRITFFGVDRNKKAIGNVAGVMGITNVPTIIVLKDGREVGRVIEYGKTGKWDEEFAALLK